MGLTEEEVIQIIKLIEESSFDELDLTMGEMRLVLRRKAGSGHPAGEAAVKAPVESIITKGPGPQPKKEKAGDQAEEILDNKLIPIKSPMLGTFYRRPSPGAPPYVEVGSFLEIGDTVCLIEVMKVFNALKAEARGTITKILPDTGDLVEYGQTLFLIAPADRMEASEMKS